MKFKQAPSVDLFGVGQSQHVSDRRIDNSQRYVAGPRAVDDMRGLDAIAYADGGSNPLAGAFACVVRFADDSELEESAFHIGATNNAMELSGALLALKLTSHLERIRVVSDSRYVVDSCGQWIHNWQRKGWRLKNNTPVKNRDLLESIWAETRGRVVEWRWTKGHSGHRWNERCDELCNQQMKLATTMYGWK